MESLRPPTPTTLLLLCFLLPHPSLSGLQNTTISPGFSGTQLNWIDKNGLFLLSPSSTFAFGFLKSTDPTLFFLGVIHQSSVVRVWTANMDSPVTTSDTFSFSTDGDVYLLSPAGSRAWSTNTKGKGATSMKLRDDGNLVVLGAKGAILWQSFDHPTDTLLPNQNFTGEMELVSEPNDWNLTFRLAIVSGDVVLSADFRSPQPYWSIWREGRRMNQVPRRDVATVAIVGNTWYFYDLKRNPLTQVAVTSSHGGGGNATWAATLRREGFISFTDLNSSAKGSNFPALLCTTPERCGPYKVCSSNGDSIGCSCPVALTSRSSVSKCDPSGVVSASCEDGSIKVDLVEVRDVDYFALDLATPTSRDSDLESCKASCMTNCSCAALFFKRSTKDCFLFDEIGSLRARSSSDSKEGVLTCNVKVPGSTGEDTTSGGHGGSRTTAVVVSISVVTALIVAGILYAAARWWRRAPSRESKKALFAHQLPGGKEEEEGEDDLLGTMSGMPVRYSYAELQRATGDFSEKLGQGGFGCVYLGTLSDGASVAVKKLEGIGQGRKEFRAEVSIIGSIHHLHLVRLRGFCAEGPHRLLAYEYMARGSLDRWLFRRRGGGEAALALDWDTRYAIAVGTAKGLAYLHEDCDSKIVHCDIKPENVLLDENFSAKVSDFGLAKLMTREQSHVFTTLRGTRGYLAPEWIISSAISEKSDVYSYGMVLLEIIGGRKSFDAGLSSEKAHLPSYAFRLMEEGRAWEVLDEELRGKRKGDERVDVAVKVALWCIQEDVALRPSMGRVVQMLEGVAKVPQPPLSSQLGYRLYANMLKYISEGEGSSSAPSDCNSDALISAVRLSGPR